MGKKNFTLVDLFCGCGGFSHGFQKAGFNVVLGVDWNKDAIDTFAVNHKGAETFHGPIQELTDKKIKELIGKQAVDMVIGGPPCQGFSTVGRGNQKDPRNFLFKEFVRVVTVLRPRCFAFENVTGLVAKKNAKVLDSILRSFRRLGYEMDAKVLQAQNYGVPSQRRRTFIVGSLGTNIGDIWPEITHGDGYKKPLVTINQAWKNLEKRKRLFNHDKSMAFLKNATDVKRLKFIPEGQGIRYEKNEKEFLPRSLRYDVDWAKLPEKRFRQTKLQRLSRKKIAPTILTSRTSYIHPTEGRYLTPREAALCQSFPMSFKFEGSQTSVFRQIGNAVPPLLAYKLGQKFLAYLEKSPRKVSKAKKNSKLSGKKQLSKTAFSYK